MLAFPFSFEGKLIQYIGRVQGSVITPLIYDFRDIQIEYLNNLFKQRNKHYRKLISAGQLRKLDELQLLFNGITFTFNSNTEFAIDCLDLPLPVENFYPGTIWKLRVLNFNDENGELLVEVIDYDFNINTIQPVQTSFYFEGIEKIKFRSLDTGNFLKSVVLKKQSIPDAAKGYKINKDQNFSENIILRTMKVLLSKA
ncbi:MAG: hypothetical protein ACR2KX_17445 [Chitinophagaceae bacterium]